MGTAPTSDDGSVSDPLDGDASEGAGLATSIEVRLAEPRSHVAIGVEVRGVEHQAPAGAYLDALALVLDGDAVLPLRRPLAVARRDGGPLLGTWQGIYLFEHRRTSHRRILEIRIVE